jgi:K+-sensing histidine kinase KdpD
MPSTDVNRELQEIFYESRRRMLSILDDALLLTEIDVNAERFRSAQVCFGTALTRALEKTNELAQSHRVTFGPVTCAYLILGDEELLVRALHALLETAVRLSAEGATIRLEHESRPSFLTVTMESLGMTIPASVLPGFFDLFSLGEASTAGKDLGLGPAVAYRILALFGASVSVENRNPSGIRLTIGLRRCDQNSAITSRTSAGDRS